MQIHSTQTFVCKLCDKHFHACKYLTNHLKTHSLMNSFQCQHCSKTFTRQKSLKAHLNTHSTEQTHSKQIFQCTICSKTFQVQRYLNMHLKTHSTERIMQFEHSFQEYTTIHVQEHNIGLPSALCASCSALHWPAEVNKSGHYTKCCHAGKVSLPPLSKPPLFLDLLTGKNPLSRNYCDHIREYNSALAFASMGAHIAQPPGQGPYAFRIYSQIYHQVSPLYTNPDTSLQYSQLYIFDSAEATSQCLQKECNSAYSDILFAGHTLALITALPFVHPISPPCATTKVGTMKSLHDSQVHEDCAKTKTTQVTSWGWAHEQAVHTEREISRLA
uniref:C2H2-type domain-containing protein n=1 Tax=Erpetoichthys calabaricus TaxID=27687 RepID=A0A8C4SKE8_ERPCA